MSRHRGWCFTLNNYTADEYAGVRSLHARERTAYVCFAPEIAASGTPHLQGYVRFQNARGLSSVRIDIPRAHWEPAAGTDQVRRLIFWSFSCVHLHIALTFLTVVDLYRRIVSTSLAPTTRGTNTRTRTRKQKNPVRFKRVAASAPTSRPSATSSSQAPLLKRY